MTKTRWNRHLRRRQRRNWRLVTYCLWNRGDLSLFTVSFSDTPSVENLCICLGVRFCGYNMDKCSVHRNRCDWAYIELSQSSKASERSFACVRLGLMKRSERRNRFWCYFLGRLTNRSTFSVRRWDTDAENTPDEWTCITIRRLCNRESTCGRCRCRWCVCYAGYQDIRYCRCLILFSAFNIVIIDE